MIDLENKLILDACCGGRMFWFNKHHPDALYVDIEKRAKGVIECRPNFYVEPDMLADFRNLPFPDKKFKLVVFDPPHLKTLTKTSIMRKKFGSLNADTWQWDLRKGFEECWRVLDDFGTLIFKWNEHDISLKEVLEIFNEEPLFGHPTAKSGKTKWCVFFKGPGSKKIKQETR